MRYAIAVLVLLAVIFSFYYWGESRGEKKHYGQKVRIYDNKKLDTLTGSGVFALDDSSVKTNTIITGSLFANGSQFGTLLVNGQANLSDCAIAGVSCFQGLFSATKCEFHNPVTVFSYKAIFNECSIDSLVVKKTDWVPGTQVVVLSNKSTCRGSITFEAGRGKLILSPDSQVLGKITGLEEPS